jgi:sugar/nucleoside kinase (ribokinase family)
VGAGDAFCAAFIYGIHESWNMNKILKKAHAAGRAMMEVDSSSGNLPNIHKL